MRFSGCFIAIPKFKIFSTKLISEIYLNQRQPFFDVLQKGCSGVFQKVAGPQVEHIWKRLMYRSFSVNFTKYFCTSILQNTSERLLLLKCYPQPYFFSDFNFFFLNLNNFTANTLDYLRIAVSGNPTQLAVPELIHCWLSKQYVQTFVGN